jgi:hypothetical protein
MPPRDFDHALLTVNGWLGRTVRLLVVVRDGAPESAQPPVGPAEGWHVVLAYEGELERPPVANDFERQLAIGTYALGDRPLKLLLDGLPCDHVELIGDEHGPDRVAFHLATGGVAVVLHALSDS